MISNYRRLVRLLVLALAMSLSLPVLAQRKGTVTGFPSEFDGVTIDGAAYRFGPELEITRNGSSVTLGQIRKGTRVEIRLSESDPGAIARIDILGFDAPPQ